MKSFKEYLKEGYEWKTTTEKNALGGINVKHSVYNNLEEIAYIKTTEPMEENQLWIQALYVAPQFRRKGLASQLVNQVKASRKNPIYLRVSPYKDEPIPEEKLIAFYEKMGFRPISNMNKVYMKFG